jgi:hypothetical protein
MDTACNSIKSAFADCNKLNYIADCVADLDPAHPPAQALVHGPYVYFRSSCIAGDNYKVSARILWNQQKTLADAQLTPPQIDALNHRHVGIDLVTQTAQIEIWRSVRLLKYVHWGRAATDWNDQPINVQTALQTVAQNYAAAFIKLDYIWPNIELEIQNANANGYGVQHNWNNTLRAALVNGDPNNLNELETNGGLVPASFLPFDNTRMLSRSFPVNDPPVIPTLQDLLNRLVLNRLNTMLNKPFPTPNWTSQEKQTLEAIWVLVHSWETVDNVICPDAVIRGWVQNAGQIIAGGLRTLLNRVVNAAGVPTFTVIDPRPASPLQFDTTTNPAVIGKCTYDIPHVPAANKYPELVDALFVPGALRNELIAYHAAYNWGKSCYHAYYISKKYRICQQFNY